MGVFGSSAYRFRPKYTFAESFLENPEAGNDTQDVFRCGNDEARVLENWRFGMSRVGLENQLSAVTGSSQSLKLLSGSLPEHTAQQPRENLDMPRPFRIRFIIGCILASTSAYGREFNGSERCSNVSPSSTRMAGEPESEQNIMSDPEEIPADRDGDGVLSDDEKRSCGKCWPPEAPNRPRHEAITIPENRSQVTIKSTQASKVIGY